MGQGTIKGGQNLEFTDTGPSRRLWAECPYEDIGSTVRGLKLFDDFENFQKAALAPDAGKYATFGNTSATLLQTADRAQNHATLNTQGFGEVALTGSAADNDDVIIQTGGNAGGLASFRDPAVAVPHDIYFEARFKINQITSAQVFVGFGDEGSTADAGVFSTGDVLVTTKNWIGFAVINFTTLIFTYQRASATVVVPISSLHTMVADTYVNVGFHYRASANPSDRKIMVYKNNVAQSIGVAKSAIVTATFPTVDALALTAALHNTAGATATVLTMDWWKFASVEN